MKNEALISSGDSSSKIFLYILKAQYILMLGYLILYPHRISGINPMIGYTMIGINLIAVVYVIADGIAKNSINSTMVAIGGLLLSLFATSVAIRDTNMAIQNISGYLFMVGFIDVQRRIKPDKSLNKFIAWITVIASVVFLIYANMPFAYRVETEDIYYKEGALTMGYPNPNAVAMLLLFFLIMTMIFSRSKLIVRPLSWIMYAEYLYLIYLTNTRAVLVAAVVLLVMNLVTVRRIPQWVFWGIMLFPVVVIFLLPYLKRIGFMVNDEILGETLYTGREKMFELRLKYLMDGLHWTFGNIGRGMFRNHHNGFFSILLSAGLFGVINYISILAQRFLPCLKNLGKTSYIAACGVLALIVHSSFEAAFMVGTIPYGLVLITLLIYSRYEEEEA